MNHYELAEFKKNLYLCSVLVFNTTREEDMMNIKHKIIMVLTSLCLMACASGGNGDDDEDPDITPPAKISGSSPYFSSSLSVIIISVFLIYSRH